MLCCLIGLWGAGRYCPPEEYVMPAKTPRPPVPFLAILLAPFTWLWGRPDLFDTYRYRSR